MRIAIVTALLLLVFSGIAALFWYQEVQYLLPTPVPKGYTAIQPNELIRFDSTLLPQQHDKPKLFHFFSTDCPCSRFNLKHFMSLNRKYGNTVDFYAVITDPKELSSARFMLASARMATDPDVPVVVDADGSLAKACGVYSTPQAALIQDNNKLYFRGNYNKSRYCVEKNSNFVQMALDSLHDERQPPHFIELATQAYGCTLSSTEQTELTIQ